MGTAAKNRIFDVKRIFGGVLFFKKKLLLNYRGGIRGQILN